MKQDVEYSAGYLRSTKEKAYYSCTVFEVVTVLYAMRFHGLDAILDRPGTLCLNLMCSAVFLARELVSILCHSFTDEKLAILYTTGLFIVFLAVFN